MARSAELGTVREADLATARIQYRERGDGPPVVFVHGLLVNADLWRGVVPRVAEAGFRCIAPDWPLGSHEVAVPDADLTPPGVAALIAEFLEKLDLHDVTIVANDTGGALTQILMTQHPERIARVVLTPSDSFTHFFPLLFRPLTGSGPHPGLDAAACENAGNQGSSAATDRVRLAEQAAASPGANRLLHHPGPARWRDPQ